MYFNMRRIEILLALGVVLILSPLATATTVTIVPKEGSFDVYCEPTQPIKAWEMSLYYDSNIISVDEVAFGSFFEGYTTFSYLHTLEGTITGYNLILGPGNISEAGNFITVQYHRIGYGECFITFSDNGVTNETQYIPAEWYDTSIFFESPEDPPVNLSIEGYFSFANEANYASPLFGWFSFYDLTYWYPIEWEIFSFRNTSSFKTSEEGYFTFECPLPPPPSDIQNTLSNNIWLITFVVLTVVGVVSFVWLGLRWQRRRQML
jgi:hypothetical protein